MKILGLMSGTSLDGLDMALCHFSNQNGRFNYQILHAETIVYPPLLQKQLVEAPLLSAEDYFKLHAEYGRFLGEACANFLKSRQLTADAIASHGHTVFHRPELGFSTQLGCGACIAVVSGLTTVCDFRSKDVALHGQGAPLVPIGDAMLFGDLDACLNIGGIANLSCQEREKRIAYDICVANMALNYLAEKLGLPYDDQGKIAGSNNVDAHLLNQLNDFSFFRLEGAKSLGREWFNQHIIPLLNASHLSVQDLLSTFTEHVSDVIAENLNKHKLKNVLATGGGAHNAFLIQRIQHKTTCKVILPEPLIINFKEALIFAFLGYLRLNNRENTLSSVTGASKNSIGGAVYLGN